MNVEPSVMAPPSLTKASETSSASSAANETDGLTYSVCRSEVRLLELNRCLQLRVMSDSTNWCEQLTADFFTDDACLTITVATGGNPATPKLFTVKRNFIPKYFSSLFHGGVTEVAFLPGPVVRENLTAAGVFLECEQACMLAHHNKPFSAQVVTRGRLSLEMTGDFRRIKTWHFSMEACQEYISCDEGAPLYQAIGMRGHPTVGDVDPAAVQKLECGLTQRGLTAHTLQFLQIQSVLQPMQVLIAHHKATNLLPRECMRAVLASSGQWPQHSSASSGTSRPPTASTPMDPPTTATTTTATANQRRPTKRQRRTKGATSGGSQAKKSSPDPSQTSNVMPVTATVSVSDAPSPFTHSLPTGFPMPGELMTVGEPIMMGGDTYTKEDERLIARVENPQYEHFEPSPSSAVMSSMPMASPATPKLASMSQATTNIGLTANQPLDVCNGMGFSSQY